MLSPLILVFCFIYLMLLSARRTWKRPVFVIFFIEKYGARDRPVRPHVFPPTTPQASLPIQIYFTVLACAPGPRAALASQPVSSEKERASASHRRLRNGARGPPRRRLPRAPPRRAPRVLPSGSRAVLPPRCAPSQTLPHFPPARSTSIHEPPENPAPDSGSPTPPSPRGGSGAPGRDSRPFLAN